MGKLVLLESEYLKVGVCPDVGAGICFMKYNLDGKWVDVMRPTSMEAVNGRQAGAFSSFNMIPYSNRIENGILRFRNKTYQLKINNPDGHAIHGEVRTRPCKVINHDERSILMEFDSRNFGDITWPFPFVSEIKYRLEGNRFTAQLYLKNIGREVMPGGMGIHPYFVRRLTGKDARVELTAPVRGVYPGEGPIPTGHWVDVPEHLDFSGGRELASNYLDRCFRVDPGPVIIKWNQSGVKLTIKADDIFKHLVVYCPNGDDRFFAVEPVTNCNNGFNMAEIGIDDTGTCYIEPGQKIGGRIEILVERSRG